MTINNDSNKKKWLTLTAVGVALLLIPRRSSRQAADISDTDMSKDTRASKDSHKSKLTDTNKSENS